MKTKPDSERLKSARKAMAETGFDALVCRLPENMLLLSGYWSLSGFSFLVFPAEGNPVLIVPECDLCEAEEQAWEADIRTFPFGTLSAGNPYDDVEKHLSNIIKSRGKPWQKIGTEQSFEWVAPPANAAEPAVPALVTETLLKKVFSGKKVIDSTNMFAGLRSIKTFREIEKIKIANEIAGFGLAAFKEKVDIGRTGAELVGIVESAVVSRGTGYKGTRYARAFAQVSTGADETALGYRPCEYSTQRKIKNGDIVLLELGVVADGFWADNTRVRAAGKPTQKQKDAYDAVRQAQETAKKACRAGVSCKEVDSAARKVIEESGFGKYFIHVTGHGIGLRYHEPIPLIHPDINDKLAAGMVHTVEPGVYIKGVGGIRIEDMVTETEYGIMELTTFDRNLSG